MPYLLYVLGVGLLAVPSAPLTRRHFVLMPLDQLADRPRHRFGWLHAINALDLARGYAGVSLLQLAFAELTPSGAVPPLARLVIGATALVTLLAQHAFQRTDGHELAAPVAYLLGLSLALLPLKVLLLVLPLGVASAIAVRNLGFGLALLAIATALLGYVLRQPPVRLASASLLFLTPVLLAGVLQRRLALTVRRRAAESPAEPLRDVPVLLSSR